MSPPGALFFTVIRQLFPRPPAGLALKCRVASRQRHAGLQSLQLDPRAGAGTQQPVSRLAQCRTALLRVLSQRCVEGRKKRGDVAVDPSAQVVVDIGSPPLLRATVG